MTPREQLIQEVLQAPDALVDALLKLSRLVRAGKTQLIQKLIQFADQSAGASEPSQLSALELAGDLVGCVEDAPEDLATNPEYMKGFGA